MKMKITSPAVFPLWGTEDSEIKVPSVENPELTNCLSLKPGVGQNIAMHASPTARNNLLVLISTSLILSLSFLFRFVCFCF